MKILKMGDWHLGVKGDNAWIQNIQRNGIRQAIEYSKLHGIKTWIQAGDVFDVRKAITHKTMAFTREMFEEIGQAGIHAHIIVGNHDLHFKERIHPNACTELLSRFSNVTVYDKITTVDFDGVKIDLTPWICDENRDEILEFIKASDSPYNIGHYELNGFYFYKGLKSHGTEPDFLAKYKLVESGHFHTQSENKNVRFIGTPWTLTAGDANDVRGFWVFDTETHENVFVQNTTMWHRSVVYPGSINPETYRNLSVRVLVTKVDANLTKFLAALESVVYELKEVNKVEYEVDDEAVAEADEVTSMADLIDGYVDGMVDLSDEEKTTIKEMTTKLYLNAQK